MDQNLAISDQQFDDIMSHARREIGRQRLPSIPGFKLSNKGSKDDVPEQHFYLSASKKNDQGEFEDQIIDVGTEPVITILHRRYSYSWYRKENKAKGLPGRLMAWTNEIEGFGPDQRVMLVNNREEGVDPFIEYDGDFQGFKAHQNSHYQGPDGRTLLKFRNVLYVWYYHPERERHLYRMFIGNSSVTGVPRGAEQGDYKNPEPRSLLKFIETLRTSEPGGVLFGSKCKLGSHLQTGGIEYYITEFENAGPTPENELRDMASVYARLIVALSQRFESEFLSLPTSKPAPKSQEKVVDVDFDNLPDVL